MGFDDDDDSLFHRKNNDVNSKIMLIAIISLSIVVLVVTLLHIYARCVLRRQARRQAALRRLGFITTSAATHLMELPKTGLDPSVIASLPVFIFKQSNEMNSIECSVCLSILEDSELVRTLPNCKHNFHAECIDKWFQSNSTCPICRTEAEPRLVPEPREGAVAAGGAPPSAPPLEGTSEGGGMQAPGKVSASTSRLSSFRRILSRERSSRSIRVQACELEDGLPDLERQ